LKKNLQLNGSNLAELRALDRLSDGQLAAAELVIWQGLDVARVAARLGADPASVRRWFRDPVFIAGCNELTRAYCAGQLVPLGLQRIRYMLGQQAVRLRDAVTATRFVAELAGLYQNRTGPEAGVYAPGPLVSGRSIADMSAADLARAAATGAAALARLSVGDSVEVDPNPLD
jgi:hypothetical protein